MLSLQISWWFYIQYTNTNTTGVLHRDIKPANIMVVLSTLSVKVIDFGIYRMYFRISLSLSLSLSLSHSLSLSLSLSLTHTHSLSLSHTHTLFHTHRHTSGLSKQLAQKHSSAGQRITDFILSPSPSLTQSLSLSLSLSHTHTHTHTHTSWQSSWTTHH